MKLQDVENQKIVLGPTLSPTNLNKSNNNTDNSFSKILKESIKEVDGLQKEADKTIFDFATGKSKSIHETMIAINKANVSFKLTMQIRNKLVEAYEEVMRMTV